MIPFPPDDIPIYKAIEAARLTKLQHENMVQEFQTRIRSHWQRRAAFNVSEAHLKEEEANMEKTRERFKKLRSKDTNRQEMILYQAAVRNLDMLRANLKQKHQAITEEAKRFNADIVQWRLNEAKMHVIYALSKHLQGPLLVDLMKDKDARFRQKHFNSKESKGTCSALALEYVHWRRAGKTAMQALEQLRSPSVMRRVQASQDVLQKIYFSTFHGMIYLCESHPVANYAYVTVYAQHFNRLKHDFRLASSAAAGFPGSSAGELSVFGSIRPQFCFAMLAYLWPGNLYKPWLLNEATHAWQQFKTLDGHAEFMMSREELDRHRQASSSITTKPSLASSSTTTTSPSPSSSSSAPVQQPPVMREEKKGSTLLRYELNVHPDVPDKEISVSDRAILMSQSQVWRRAISSELDGIFKVVGRHGYVLCFLAIPAKWGHLIMIDFDPRRPGVFDPNFGFIPLPSCDSQTLMLHWLLAFFVFVYSVNRIDFMYVPNDPDSKS